MGKESYLLGRQGEEIAQKYLIEQGFRIVDLNFRSRQGEVDIVAYDGFILVFIEVKNYSFRSYGSPVGAVTKTKKHSLIHAAKTYLAQKNIRDLYCRFDVVAIFHRQGGGRVIEHFRNAFTLTGR